MSNPFTRSPGAVVSTSPLLILAGAFALGVVSENIFQVAPWACVSVSMMLTAVAGVFVIKRRLKTATVAAVFAIAWLGMSFARVERIKLPQNQLRVLLNVGTIPVGEPVELIGVLKQEPELAPEHLFLTIDVQQVRIRTREIPTTGTVSLQLHDGSRTDAEEVAALDLHYGAKLRVLTRIERTDSFRNPGVSSFTEYLDRKGTDATGVIKSPRLIERLENEAVFLPLSWLYAWRNQLQHLINSHFSTETAGVLDAALLGNRFFLTHSSSERFREGGTFHVLVISGLHITFLGGIAFFIARKLTRKRIFQFVLANVVLWSYTLAVGAEASVVRAAVMFTLVILAPLLSRHATSRNALGASAIILLAWRPSNLFDPSFQLTFASVAAIVMLSWPLLEKLSAIGAWQPSRDTPYPPACARWLRSSCEVLFWSEKKWQAELAQSNHKCILIKNRAAVLLEKLHLQRLLRYGFSTIVVSIGVQLVLLPFLIIYFHRLSFASLVLNIGVSCLMALTTATAAISLILLPVGNAISSPVVALTNGLNWLTVHSVDPFTRFGVASVRLPEYSGPARLIYALYFVPLILVTASVWAWNPLALRTPKRTWTLKIALFLQATAMFLVVAHPHSARPPDGRLHVEFLDVGQGDSALITTPEGITILIDGGGRPGPFRRQTSEGEGDNFQSDSRGIGEAVVSEFLWYEGLDKVDYILATHADADHIDGLNDVARNFYVRSALIARTPANDSEFLRFSQTLKERNVPIQVIGAGDKLFVGGLIAEVLWPPADASGNLPSQNNDSIVLKVTFGKTTFLLTGDIEARAESALIDSNADLHSTVVKVAHHGSKTSSTTDFIAATHPQYAVISVGQTSIFGHPAPQVVKRWQDAGTSVLQTGRNGTVSFSTNGNDLQVDTFVKPR